MFNEFVGVKAFSCQSINVVYFTSLYISERLATDCERFLHASAVGNVRKNIGPMTLAMRTQLPYIADSTRVFESVADLPWASFLDSGRHGKAASRFDFIVAEPYVSLITRGPLTEVHRQGEEVLRLTEDPFVLIRRYLDINPAFGSDLPFSGGALGYFAYDLARRIEKLPSIASIVDPIPDMAIGIYDWALVVDHEEKKSWLVGHGRDPQTKLKWERLIHLLTHPAPQSNRMPFVRHSGVESSFTRERYVQAFEQIQRYIKAGDCYQVNLAQRFSAQVSGDPWLAYQRLRCMNPAPFSAYLSTPSATILSTSPESFLSVHKGLVQTKPIKGTRPRSGQESMDLERIWELKHSEKDQAENVMIVDLLRNDLAKNCVPGSIKVPSLFQVESFETVHHLVSTVTGQLQAGRDAIDLLREAFPGGSITGAPKLRAMQIIEALEGIRRGLYCGAIGYIGFDGDMQTNIAIRTVTINAGQANFWAGGGIVADSVESKEYEESFDKARALLNFLVSFDINPYSSSSLKAIQ